MAKSKQAVSGQLSAFSSQWSAYLRSSICQIPARRESQFERSGPWLAVWQPSRTRVDCDWESRGHCVIQNRARCNEPQTNARLANYENSFPHSGHRSADPRRSYPHATHSPSFLRLRRRRRLRNGNKKRKKAEGTAKATVGIQSGKLNDLGGKGDLVFAVAMTDWRASPPVPRK